MAYSLHDYLEIGHDEAVRQWRVIQLRQRPEGKRQEPFRPVEVVLCFALFRLFDPRRFGGGNIHLLPESAQVLAKTLRRPPGSLTNKMLNLCFDRKHGAKAEPEVFLQLSLEPDRFLRLYRTVIDAARDVGFDEAAVPDVVVGVTAAQLLGQDELGCEEIGISVEAVRDAVETACLRKWFGEQQTERFVEQKVRLGQHRFAAAVLDAFDHRCGFCGFSPGGLGAGGMLLASHIKPWARCASDRERLDPRNGIAACPMHDKAFDGGLLTVNGGLRIHRAQGLEARLGEPMTGAYFGSGILQSRLLLGAQGEAPGKHYLEYHREHVFDRAS